MRGQLEWLGSDQAANQMTPFVDTDWKLWLCQGPGQLQASPTAKGARKYFRTDEKIFDKMKNISLTGNIECFVFMDVMWWWILKCCVSDPCNKQ